MSTKNMVWFVIACKRGTEDCSVLRGSIGGDAEVAIAAAIAADHKLGIAAHREQWECCAVQASDDARAMAESLYGFFKRLDFPRSEWDANIRSIGRSMGAMLGGLATPRSLS